MFINSNLVRGTEDAQHSLAPVSVTRCLTVTKITLHSGMSNGKINA
jgi:hypothetical protein